MNHRTSRQKGMTLISFLLLLAIVGFNILLALKILPIYLEHYKVTTSLNSLKNEPEIAEKSPKEIMAMLQKRWDINDITRITAANSLTIEGSGGNLNIQVEYDAEAPILGNVSALIRFQDSITVGDTR